MSLTVLTFDQILANILQDWESLNPNITTDTDSDNYVRAAGFASAVEGILQYGQWGVRQMFADTADSAYLERHAATMGLARKPAGFATGSILVTGTAGVDVPLGTAFSVGSLTYVTTQDMPIGAAGNATIPAQATVAGSASNQASSNVPATLTSAPANVSANATLVSMTSGTDVESDASLLGRYLALKRSPPRGGSAADWKFWAQQVVGVQNAYVYPLRSGNGTVDVCITTSSGVPSAQLIAAVVAYITPLVPCDILGFNIVAPTPQSVAVTVQTTLATGYSLAGTNGVQAQITAALTAYFAALPPAATVYKSQIEALISDIPGIVDRVVSAPAANFVPTVNTTQIVWATLGAVAVS